MPGRLASTTPSSITDSPSPRSEQDHESPASTSATTPIPTPITPTQTPTQAPPPPSPPNRTTIRNRRLRYLELHPDYFRSADLELADPLLYDRLIRSYLSTSERESQGRERGHSGVLEADLQRAEAKMSAIRDNETPDTSRFENDRGEEVSTKEEGEELWKKAMTLRFLRGGDVDADYNSIDNSDEFDDWKEEEREAQEKWFDAQTPETLPVEELKGETGVLDY